MQSSVVGHTGSVAADRGLWSVGAVAMVHGLSCSVLCGVFPDRGWNPSPLRRQVDSYLQYHQGSPASRF